MATTRVNGVELYYETTGIGDCLVLTHGSWTDGTGWDRVVGSRAPRRGPPLRSRIWSSLNNGSAASPFFSGKGSTGWCCR